MECIYQALYDELVTNGSITIPDIPIEMEIDASDTAIGAALFQKINGERKYISFNSRVL